MQMEDKTITPTTVRAMKEEDYDKVYRLWKTIKGFGIEGRGKGKAKHKRKE